MITLEQQFLNTVQEDIDRKNIVFKMEGDMGFAKPRKNTVECNGTGSD